MKVHTYQYVHAVEEAALIVLLACRRKHILLLYDMASSLPEQLANLPVFRMKPIRKLLDRIEKWLIFKADYIVCSRGLLPHIEKSGGKNSVCEWWFPTIIKEIDVKEKVKIRTDLGIGPDDHLFVYAGSFAPYQGIELLLDAIALLRDHPAQPRFLLAGATPEELSRIQVRWGQDTPPNVTLLGRQAKEKVVKFLASADFLISPRLYGANTPLKVFDYMGAGKPIIASDIFAHRVILDESRAVFFKNSAESLASAIADLMENRHKAIQLAEHSKAYAQAALTWPRFLDDIKRITSELGAAEIVKFGSGSKP
jgi:glycosyltransferase involved in cell wall biosynthesis